MQLRKRKYNSLCVVAIFKNECHAMREWIKHYLNEGVQHFFLIDNGSTDGSSECLFEFDCVTLVYDDKKHAQEELYNRYYLKDIQQYDWALVVDLDEFLYARNNKSIREVLTALDENVSELQVRWKMFGSSGFKNQPSRIIPNFRQRCDFQEQKQLIYNVKSFVRTSRVTWLGAHEHRCIENKRIVIPRIHKECFLSRADLHVNHYRVQSHDHFVNNKLKKGDVSSTYMRNIREQECYFEDNDFGGVEDNELSNKTYDSSKKILI
jgi:hypothetical protein